MLSADSVTLHFNFVTQLLCIEALVSYIPGGTGHKYKITVPRGRAPHLKAVVLPEDAAVNGLDDDLVLHA